MVIFSNGQFDVLAETYIFDPKKDRFVPIFDYDPHLCMDLLYLHMGKFSREHPDLVLLEYEAELVPPDNEEYPNRKDFIMQLFNNGKIIGEPVESRIYKSKRYESNGKMGSYNEYYEEQVKRMIRKAREISQKTEILEITA